MYKILTLSILIALSSCSFSGNDKADASIADNASQPFVAPANWQTYSSGNYSIHYSPLWTLVEEQEGTFFKLAFQEDLGSETFTNSIRLYVNNLKDSVISLDSLASTSIGTIKYEFTNFKIVSKIITKANNINWKKVVAYGEHDTVHYSIELWDAMFKGKSYMLMFVCMNSSFKKDRELAEEIMGTFSIQ